MSSSLIDGILSLIFRLPQAHDDNFLSLSTGLTEDSTGTVYLSVTANDAGKVKSLYSIDDGGSWFDVLQLLWRDTARTEATSSDNSDDHAKIWITTDGRVAYDASTWSAAFRAEIQHLAAGEYAEDSFIYAIQLSSGLLSWAHVTLQIAGVNDAPVATPSMINAVEGGAVVTGQVSATDVDHGAILTYGLVDPAPAGLQLTAGGGYTFDPTVPAYDDLPQGATEILTTHYRVTDEHGASDTSTLTITVTGVNDAPVAVADVATAGENQRLSIDVLANDTDVDDGHVLSVVAASGPQGKGTVTTDGQKVLFDPGTDFDHLAQGASQTVTFNYSIKDEYGAASSATVQLTVTGENDAPVAVADKASGGEHDVLSIDVLANDTDADDGHVLTLVSATGPDGKGTVSIDGNMVVFDPGTAFDHLLQGESETVHVAYTIHDEHGAPSSSFVDVTVTGAGGNDAPVAVADSAAGGENDVLTIDVLANDTEAGQGHVLTLVSATAPEGEGRASINANMVVFDPGTAFDHLAQGQSGTVRVAYTIQDEHGAPASSFVDLTVTGENDAPVAVADAAGTSENQTLGIDVLANDTDVDDGHVLTLVSATADREGTVSLDGNLVVFDPGSAFDHLAEGATQTVRVAYTMQDQDGAPSNAFVDVTVIGENDAPLAAADAVIGAENQPLSIDVLANDTDADDGHLLTLVSVAALDSKGAASLDGNLVVFDPGSDFDRLAAGASDTVQLSYTIQDERGAQSSALVGVTVMGENDAPIAAADTAIGVENQGLSVDVLANDTDADDGHLLTLVSVDGPVGKGTASLDGNLVVFDPGTDFDHLAEGASETVTLNYSMNDEHGAASNSIVQLTITGENDAPVAAADTAIGAENQRLSFDVLANDTDVDDGHVFALVSARAPDGRGTASLDGNMLVFDAGMAFDHLAQGASETVRVAYTMQDEHGAQSTSFVDVTMVGENDAPVAVADNASGGENDVLSIDVLGNDTDVDDDHVLTLVSVTAPDGKGTVSVDGNTVVFDPGTDFDHLAQGASEMVTLNYSISDEQGAASNGSVQLTIIGENDAPLAIADAAVGGENQRLSLDVLANDTDVDDGHVFTVLSATAPDGKGTATVEGNRVVFDPGTVFDHLAQGQTETVRVAYTMQDERGAPASSFAEVIVTGENDAPVAVADTAGGGENDVLTIDVLANDTDVDDGHLLTVLGASAPAGFGSASVVGNQVMFDPGSDFDRLAAGASEKVPLSYTMQDERGAQSSSTIEVTLNGVNDAPVARDDAASTDEDTPANGNVLTGANGGADSDVDGDVLSVATVGTFTTALGATLTLGADGAFTYDPTGSTTLQGLATGQSAVDTFTYSVSDGNGGTDSATLSVTVAGVNEPVKGSAVLPSLEPGTNLDYYIRFEGAGVANGWMKLGAFSNSFTMDGGTGAGKITVSDVQTLLGSNSAMPNLAGMLGNGTHLNGVEIEAYSQFGQGAPQLVDQYFFSDAAVTDLRVTALGGSTADSIGFDFGGFAHSHQELDDKGAPGTVSSVGWDFTNAKPGSVPSHSADALSGEIADALPAYAQLSYFVTYDGAPGWLHLSSFNTGMSGGAGSATSEDATLTLGSSKQLVELTQALLSGTHLKNVEVEAYSMDGQPRLVDEYTFQDVSLSGLTTWNATNNTLSFDYGRYAEGHIAYDANGAQGTITTGGWDFTNNTTFSAGTPAADAIGNQLAGGVGPETSLDYYIRFDGPGVANTWLKLGSFNHGFDTDGVGTVSASDVAGMLGSTAAMPDLFEMLANGTHLNGVEIEAYSQGNPQLVDQYFFSNAVLTDLQVSGSGGATTDSVSFDFAGFAHSHQELDAKGALGPVTSVGWDFVNAQPGSVPAHTADALTAKLSDSLPIDAPLQYFMTYDGAPGWLAVNSFDAGMSGGAGQVTPEDAMLTLGSSKELVQLSGMLLSGKQLTGIEVEAWRMDGAAPRLVDEYKFQDVTLTKLDTINASANALSFDYAKYAEGHVCYDAKGAPSTITTGGWDFANNAAFSGGTPSGDAVSKQIAGGVAPGTDLDYYIRFDTAGVLNSWLKLGAFSDSLAADGGKATASDVAGLLGSNAAMPSLIEMLGNGTHLGGVEIEAYSQGTSQLVDQYFFSDAVLTALQVSGSSGFTGDSVSFDFGGFAHSHQELDAKGAAGPVSSVGWDFVNAAPGSVPAHTADALSGEVADSLPIDAPLSYFVTYDGAPGWLQASSFSTGMSGGAGPATAEDVMLALGSSKQLVELTQTLLSGKHLKSVEVEAYRMDSAQPQLVDEYKFEDVVLNGLSAWSPTENGLSFSYAKYAEGHIAYNADGTQGTITTGGWDFSHNTAFSGGTPHADIDFTA